MAKYQGQVAAWQEAKGFGFITPLSGGKQVFFHANTWVNDAREIVVGTQVKYDLSTDNKSRVCAVNVEPVPLLLDGETIIATFKQWSSDGQLGLLINEDHPKTKILLPKSVWKGEPLHVGHRMQGTLKLHQSGSWVLLQPSLVTAASIKAEKEAWAQKQQVAELQQTQASQVKKPVADTSLEKDMAWRENMSLKGVLSQWQDDKGFGFLQVEPNKPRVFFHISDYIEFDGRPENGMVVQFVLRQGDAGQWRAGSVQCVQKPTAKKRLQSDGRHRNQNQGDVGSVGNMVFAVVLGVLFLGGLAYFSEILAIWSLVMSILSFSAYSSDKKAALRKTWRVSENRLHFQDLLGGWPGGLLARQVWRHKVSKTSFVITFWLTVALNILAMVWIWRHLGEVLPTFI